MGRVFASELGINASGDPLDVPLEGATIIVDSMEDALFAITDEAGNFCLDPVPVGRFFVHIDGRTATNNVPEGAYYPFVGKAWEPVPGTEVNIGSVFLPLVVPGTLQPVSDTQDTEIAFPPAVLAQHPEFAGVQVTVPSGSIYADDGSRGGMVGIAPVPPDRLPGTLPEGLEFPVVITVQTDGAANFDVPAPVCFPNLPDPVLGEPLPPGERNFLYSFNHDTGQFEPVGPMTVTEDGGLICTNPGVGILAPGWHGSGPVPVGPPPPPASPAPSGDPDRCFGYCYNAAQMCAHCGAGSNAACVGCAIFTYLWSKCTDSSSTLETTVGDEQILSELLDLTTQIREIAHPYAVQGMALPPDKLEQTKGLVQQMNELAGGNILDFVEQLQLEWEHEVIRQGGDRPSNSPSHPLLYLASIERPNGQLHLRGQTGPHAQFSLFVPRGGVLWSVSVYDPIEKMLGAALSRVTPNQPFPLFPVDLYSLDDSDSDLVDDSLADLAELVFGTDPANPDTDGDGISDGAEVQQGTDPLDGLPARTGIIATVDTPGDAVDVTALNNLVAVADSEAGVSLFSVLNGQNPTIIAQVNTPGTAQRVAMDGNLLAIADGSAGLAVIDVADPPAASIVHQVDVGGSAQAVVAAAGLAYVGISTEGVAVVDLASGTVVDLASGTVLDRVLLEGNVQDVALGGDYLYGMTTDRLHAVSLAGGPWRQLAPLPRPSLPGRTRGYSWVAASPTPYTARATIPLTSPIHASLPLSRPPTPRSSVGSTRPLTAPGWPWLPSVQTRDSTGHTTSRCMMSLTPPRPMSF